MTEYYDRRFRRSGIAIGNYEMAGGLKYKEGKTMGSDQMKAEAAFLKAFDAMIETVFVELAETGLPEEAIWLAFKQAVGAVATFSSEIAQDASRHNKRTLVADVACNAPARATRKPHLTVLSRRPRATSRA